jgi:methionyl-tRNA formyltransferase
MRAIIVGAVESTRVALSTVAAASGWSVEALITLPADQAARHSDFVDLSASAEASGARVIRTTDGNAPSVLDEIRALAPNCVLVIGWSQICKPAFLAAAGERAIGFHPAPLPRLRGRAVIPWTILLDEKITGSTLFWIDKGVDTGPILAQRFAHVAPDETAASLYAKHLAALTDLLAEALPKLADGTASRLPQDERYATWAAKRTAEDGLIDWTRPAAEVWRLVRAIGRPYPGAYTLARGRQLVIWRAMPWPLGGAGRYIAGAGQIVASDTTGFAVRCGDGLDLWVQEFELADDGGTTRFRLHERLGKA